MSVNLEVRNELPEEAMVLGDMFMSYDNSIIGFTTDGRVVYDYDKMIEELMQDEEWSYEDAVEWIEYNTVRSLPYGGPGAPIIMYRL